MKKDENQDFDLQSEMKRFERLEYLVALFHSINDAADAVAETVPESTKQEMQNWFDEQRAEILMQMEDDYEESGPFSTKFLRTLWQPDDEDNCEAKKADTGKKCA